MPGQVSSPFGDKEDMEILDSPDEAEETKPGTEDEEAPEDSDEDEAEDEDEESDEDEEEEEKSGKKKKGEADAEPEDDEQKLGNFPDRPTYAQIKKYDPDFFKKFPGMRNLVFQEQAYREIFSTAEEAKDAAEELGNYRAVEKNITSGDPDAYLEILEQYDRKTATDFTDRFLPTLAKTRPELFQRITQPYLKHVLRTIANRAGNDENLKNSILHIHKQIFGDFDVDKNVRIAAPKEPEKDEKYEKEKQQYYTQRETDFRTGTTQSARTELTKVLDKLIDPKGSLSAYDKKNITRDVLESVDQALAADTQHMSLMGSLWARAKKSGWSSEFKERISTAYLSRVKVVAPSIVQKAKSEALKARGKSNGLRSSTESSKPNGSGRPSSARVKDDEIDWKKSSDLDILNDTPKRRK